MSGYTHQQLEDIQGQWSIKFPPDLIDIYRERRSVIPDGFDWLRTPKAHLREMFDWPLEGLLFDLQHNVLWLSDWGEKPANAADAEEILRAAVAAAPKLIPVFGHRYIPETPRERGNPIFSVYQSDIIFYGADLEQYVLNETGRWSPPARPPRQIPFWSEFTE